MSCKDNPDYYEQSALWGRLDRNPNSRTRLRMVQALVPEDASSVLDVGCGDGYLLKAFGNNRRVVLFDRSEEPLKHLAGPAAKLRADCARMPFKARSFDLVAINEVLEHLPHGTFVRTIRELDRVARDYILVGVPNTENLRQTYVRCCKCGTRYHGWEHHRSFRSPKALDRLFRNFTAVARVTCGGPKPYTNRLVLAIRQHVCNEWYWHEAAVCPKCGGRNQKDSIRPRKLLLRVASRLLWRVPTRRELMWLLCLYKRKDNTQLHDR